MPILAMHLMIELRVENAALRIERSNNPEHTLIKSVKIHGDACFRKHSSRRVSTLLLLAFALLSRGVASSLILLSFSTHQLAIVQV